MTHRNKIKNCFKKIPLFRSIIICLRKEKKIWKWRKNGRPTPPPHLFKQKLIKKYAKKYKIKTFVETGTHHGQMIWALKNSFEKIFTIELSEALYKKAKIKFSKFNHIKVFHGDSGILLKTVLAHIREPCCFWLDAHYSKGDTVRGEKETPIIEELNCILKHPVKKHIILIDDAREFKGRRDYPTIKKLKELVSSYAPEKKVEVKDDIIRIF